MIRIRDDLIKDAFRKVKKDMDELRDVQKFSVQAINTKMQSTENELKYRLENSMTELKKGFETKINAHEHRELGQLYDKTNINLKKISSRLQELENISVDVDDISGELVNKHDLDKKLSRLSRKIDKAMRAISDYNEEKYSYASLEKLKDLKDNLIELKSELVLRQDIEQINDRLDNVESRFVKRADSLKKEFDALEKEISDVYSLKKAFVSKEQFINLRKEIRMLVEGLKEIQKIKKRLDKSKTSDKRKAHKTLKKSHESSFFKKSIDAVVDFFVEEDVEEKSPGKKRTGKRPAKKNPTKK